MALPSVKAFRNITLREHFFGLAVEEWAAWLVATTVLFGVSSHLVMNLAAMGLSGLSLFWLKSRKPEGFLQAFAEHWTAPKELHVDLEIPDA